MTASEDLRARASDYPERTAVSVVDGPSMTFSEWDARANSAARSLARLSVDRGDRVALVMSNRFATDFHVAYIACLRSGAAAVPVNPRYADREVAHVISDSGAAVVITDEENAERVAALGSSLPSPVTVVSPGARGGTGADWKAMVSADQRPFEVRARAEDLAEILYTSGTTGLPKGVASTHANSARNDMSPIAAGGRLLHSIPLATFTGLQGALLTPLRLAVTSLVLPRFAIERFAELIELERPLWLLMVPAQILLLLESGSLSRRDTSSVKVVMFGGSPTPAAAVERLGAELPGAVLLNGYGLTEGGGSVCVLPPGAASSHPGSVGRPMPGVSLRIVSDSGAEVARGETGEITLRLAAGERRYLNDPEATSRTWRDGWVHTGDLGRVDRDGYLYVVGRKKDVIIRGGYNISPVEVEDALFEHPAVAEVAVVGRAHPVLGQDLCAVMRCAEGTEAPSLEELRRFLAPRLADYKLPRSLVLTERPLPRTSMGKPDRRRLLGEIEGGDGAPPGVTG